MTQHLTFRIAEKRWESPDAVSLVLEQQDGPPMAYEPGQYLTVLRNQQGQELRRAYSFSSCPGADALPAITVRRVPNGLFSNWLVQDAAPGDILRALPPAGRFVLPEKAPRRLLYLAAGSGITPVMSHLKALLVNGQFDNTPVDLFFANRDSRHTLFKAQLDAWQATFSARFSCTHLFSREPDAPNARFGHLSNSLWEQLVEEKVRRRERAGTQVYLCAPTALMRMARMTLRVLDFPERNIHQETFVPDLRLRQREIDTSRQHHIRITTRTGQTIDFAIYAGETILQGALRQGHELPYTCKSGICFSCLARCVQGQVDVQFVEQTLREGPGGLVNTCIGYPVTDTVELAFE